jgi:MFS family permease
MHATMPADRHFSPPLVRALATTTSIQILSTATALALTAIAPTVSPLFGVPAYWVGYQISLIYLAGAVSCAAAGTLVDLYGAVRIEQVALASYMLGLLALISANPSFALVGSLSIGAGYGLQNPASSQILGAITPRSQRNLVFSIKQAGVPLGGVIASLAVPWLQSIMGWRAALTMLGVLQFSVIALLAHDHAGELHRRPPRRSFLGGFLAEQRLVWSREALRILSILGMLYSSIQLSLSAFAVTMLVAAKWNLFGAGAAAGLIQLAGALGRISWGVIADRIRSGFAVLAIVGFVSVGCMISLFWVASLPHLATLAILALFGFCISGWNGVMMAEAAHHCAPADTGRVIGGTLVYTFLGVTIGPAAFATGYDACGDYGLTFALGSVIPLLGGIMAGVCAFRKPA